MTNLDIAHQRLHNQYIASATFENPGDVVRWFSAVQAQDYAAAKWAVGLRLQSATDDDIEQAFAPNLLTPLNKTETRALAASANCYGAFLDRSVNASF